MFRGHFPRVPIDRVRGSLSSERLADAGERVRGAIQKAATYEPSPRVQQIKEDAIDVGRTVRSEIAEVGAYYAGRGGGGRRSRRERRARYIKRQNEPDPDDYYAQRSIENYAAAFSPPHLRIDWQGRQSGRRYTTDAAYQSMSSQSAEPMQDEIVFENEYADYLQNFDPYARRSSGKKRQKSDDLIGMWFTKRAG